MSYQTIEHYYNYVVEKFLPSNNVIFSRLKKKIFNININFL